MTRPSPDARPARRQAHSRPLAPPVAVCVAVAGGVAVLPRRRDRAPWAGGGPRGYMVARAELNNVSQVSHCRDLVQLPVAA